MTGMGTAWCGQTETVDLKKQGAYILPKPAGHSNNFGNVQVIFPNQITDSSKVRDPLQHCR